MTDTKGPDIVERLRTWSGACLTPEQAAQQGPYITELLRRAADEIERFRRGECICIKCGLRQDGEHDAIDF